MKHELDTAAQVAVEGGRTRCLSPYRDGNVRICNPDGSYNPILSALGYVRANPTLVQLALRKRQTDTTVQQSLVIIESPYSGSLDNTWYARSCLEDCLERGEAPLASHLLYTQVLIDAVPEERAQGIEAGLAWYRVAEKCVVYTDRGISEGMRQGIARAEKHGVPVEYRSIQLRSAA